MKIAWDARVLVNGSLRGMGTYAFHLLPSLQKCRPDFEFILFHDGGTRPLPVEGFAARRIGPVRGYRWQLWEQLGLPLQARWHGCNLIHSPANTTPPRSVLPRVVTLHDAMPFHAWNTDASALAYFRRTQRLAVASADAIITDSAYSKQDICELLDVPPARVSVIPLAPSPELTRPDDTSRATALDKLGINRRFVLGLAATAQRKNTRGILRAFAQLRREVDDVLLVLTGVGPELNASIAHDLRALQIPESEVRRLGFVGPEELAALYAGCAAFWFLSLYEGFGLPILDAMQCGAPVVCSTRTSCPEVAGNAAVMVDPENAEEVAAAAGRVLKRDPAEQETWRNRGYARASSFTWLKTAMQTAYVYDSVV